ncbi:hypothetical protein AVEN_82396-1 [Araneus ventricosus]|uniref:Uncharacterized protein n=1 Tax=Araneus ventricosus TaxID=182803 RepID=A0A4Y2SQM5_ARAVE|nr:hypothetical protein AVEN_82396-1 [Araneus ventricosus]
MKSQRNTPALPKHPGRMKKTDRHDRKSCNVDGRKLTPITSGTCDDPLLTEVRNRGVHLIANVKEDLSLMKDANAIAGPSGISMVLLGDSEKVTMLPYHQESRKHMKS